MKGAEGSVCLCRLWLLVYPAPTTKLCYSQAVGPSLGRAAALSTPPHHHHSLFWLHFPPGNWLITGD